MIPQVFQIFATVATHFRESTEIISRNIDSKKMVSTLIKDCNILSNYTTFVCDMSIVKVCKEVSLNLLEHLIMLYVSIFQNPLLVTDTHFEDILLYKK